MSMGSYIIFSLLLLSAVIILSVSLKSDKPFSCLLLSAFSGIGSLFAVNIASAVSGVSLAVNSTTLLISGIGGIPGTVFLLLSDVIISKV